MNLHPQKAVSCVMTFLMGVCVQLLSVYSWAAALPQSSPYDSRMQKVVYNAANTTIVNARLGFLTTLVFNSDETVVTAKSGFDSGWDISSEGNKVYISPRPATQEQEIINEAGEKEKVVTLFEPNAAEWNTNLFVTSNKRDYSLELNLSSADSKKRPPVFVLNFQYPDEDRARDRQQQQAQAKALLVAQEKKIIGQKLDAGQAPRNWDYFMRVGKDSLSIAPDFAYDDGERTYLGFASHKVFPSAFLYINGKEQVVNMSSRQQGNYKVMVIHSLSNHFVLRYGDQVVGIVNSSFGRFASPYKNTSSPEVERVEVSDD